MSDDEMSPAERPYENLLSEQVDEGRTQIQRRAKGLLVASFAAGLYIGFGPLLMATVETVASGVYSTPTVDLLTAFMYSIGFIFVVISQTDLYTEIDTRAMYPVLTGKASVAGLGRLWALVIVGNIVGGIVFSFIAVNVGTAYGFVEPSAFAALATEYTTKSTLVLFFGGIIAGWLMGLAAWLVDAAGGTGSRTFYIIIATGAIAFMHLPHSIAGNVEVFMGLLVDSPVSWFDWGRFLAATLVGNAIGGVVFVALLTYAGRPQNDDG